MADKKITDDSLLSGASVDIANDVIPIVDVSEASPSDRNKKITPSELKIALDVPSGLANVLTDGNDGGGLQIKNIADPTLAQDAATKNYVDNQVISVPDATPSVKGIAKLYSDLSASNTDGSVTQAGIKTVTDAQAPLANPTFTGTPAAPTAAQGTNTTQIATTAFVIAEKLVSAFYNWVFGIVSEANTTHTFVLTDSGKIIRSSNAATSTFTIPLNSSIAYPVGSWIEFERTHASASTVLAPDAGVTFITEDPTNLTIRKQYGKIRATKVDTDTWHIAHSPSSWWEFAKSQAQTVTAKWTFTGTDDSAATVSVEIKNQSGDTILKTYNDQTTEFGGSAFELRVGTSITSGNAALVVNDSQDEAFSGKDASSNKYFTLKSSTGGNGRQFVIKKNWSEDVDLGFSIFNNLLQIVTDTVNSGHNVIKSISLATGDSLEILVTHALAHATNGNVQSLAPVRVIAKNTAGTVTVANETLTNLQLGAASGGWNFNVNGTAVEFRFQNETTGRTYHINAKVSYILRPAP